MVKSPHYIMKKYSDAIKKLLCILIPASFFAGVLLFVHFDKVFEYELDEGVYLMRAYLCAHGHALYKEIWMDQPPVLVLMLSALFKVFGPSVYAARLLILTFSTLLIWSLYQIIKRSMNTLSALAAVVFLALSPLYARLSVTVISSLCSIAIAILAIYGIFLYRESHKRRFLLLSGGVFALALLTRFFAVIFLPGILCEIAAIEKERKTGKDLRAGLVYAYSFWAAAFSAVFFYIAFVAAPIDFSQLWQPYVMSRNTPICTHDNVLIWLNDNWNVVLLVIGALIFLKREDRKFFLVPFISFMFGTLVFLTHRPIWTHHRLYIIVPLCWLASFSVYALCREIAAEWGNRHKALNVRSVTAVSFLSISLLTSMAIIPFRLEALKYETQLVFPDSRDVVSLMKKYKEQTHMVVTDRPIFAFYADMPVSPYLVSSSAKRMKVGLLMEKDFLRVISEDKPELILFARYTELNGKIAPYIQKDYELEYEDPELYQWLYVLRSIKKQP